MENLTPLLDKAYQFLKADFAQTNIQLKRSYAWLSLDMKKEGRNVVHKDKAAWDGYKAKLMLQLLPANWTSEGGGGEI